MLETIRRDIREMKERVDKVIVVWTANTERFCEIVKGINDTADNLLNCIKNESSHISPSTLFAVAAILEQVINYKCLCHIFYYYYFIFLLFYFSICNVRMLENKKIFVTLYDRLF